MSFCQFLEPIDNVKWGLTYLLLLKRERFIVRNWFTWLWTLANGSIKSAGWSPRRDQCSSLSLNAVCYRIRKSTVINGVQGQSSRDSLAQGRLIFLFYSELQLIGWGPPNYEEQFALLKIHQLNVNPIQKHSHWNIQNNLWPNIWAACSPVTLTHKINLHRYIVSRHLKPLPPGGYILGSDPDYKQVFQLSITG